MPRPVDVAHLPPDSPLAPLLDSGALAWLVLGSLPHTALVVFDTDLRIVAAGGGALEFAGMDTAAMTGALLENSLPAEVFNFLRPIYERVLKGEHVSIDVPSPYGGRIYHSEFTPLRDPGGALIGVISVARDVTTERQDHDEAKRLRQQFENAFQLAPIGMALVGLDGRWLRVNRQMCAITGYEEGQLLELTFQDITHPDDLDADLALLDDLLRGERHSYTLEKRYITASGEQIWALLSVSLVRDTAGEPQHFISQIEDISERKRLEERLHRLADHDSLTGLWNRRRFEEELRRQIGRCHRYGERAALLVVDLDGFKPVNDAHGHPTGDAVLKEVSRALRSRLRDSDSIARIGGDEFAIMLTGVSRDETAVLVRELTATISAATVDVDGVAVAVDGTIGSAPIDETTGGLEDLFAAADRAMYAAKSGATERPRTP